jgi:hypothetical protein
MPFPRRRRVPPVVAAVTLDAERRVGWALTTSGEPVVVTDQRLHLPGAEPLPWGQVEKAVWRRPTLTVRRLAPVEGSGPSWTVELGDDDGDVPEQVRARVNASVAWSSHSRLVPAGGVRVVARRRVDRDDAFDWQVVFDRDTDPHDPSLQAQAEERLEAARRTIG